MLVRFQEIFFSLNFGWNVLKGILDDDCVLVGSWLETKFLSNDSDEEMLMQWFLTLTVFKTLGEL